MRVLSLTILLVLTATLSFAQSFPANFSRAIVGGTFSNPTVMAFAPDGRIFVCEQGGAVRIIKDGTQLATPFVSVTTNAAGERGLIGITFDPDFNTNHHIYLYYTTTTNVHNRISRFTANGDVAVAGSEQIVLELDPLSGATNHNGGFLGFGHDGKLYVAVGDNANSANATNLDTYHGKLLRINKDGSAPADNPFPTGSEQRKRVWSYGLRNPYTFAIHPVTGRILVNDVGQSTAEEVNDASVGGRNFGWPSTEGYTSNAGITSPIFRYLHTGAQPTGCAITGGTFFSPSNTNYPSTYQGKFFFMDHCDAWIYYFDPSLQAATSTAFATSIGGSSVGLTVGPDGNLYYLSRATSRLYRVVYTPPATAPVITTQPESTSVVEGETATFTVAATGTAPIAYQWYRNDQIMGGKTSATLSISPAAESDEGTYHVVVSNGVGPVTSNDATLTVSPANNESPVITIIKPLSTDIYRAGTTIAYEATATDPEDGTLAASAFKWNINFHHDTHKHDQPAITGVKSGTFEIPNRGETSSNVWYRIILTVTDSEGRTAKDSVDVHPKTSTLKFETDPAGFEVLIDGQPVISPVEITSVVGLERDIEFIETHQDDGKVYMLQILSPEGPLERTIVTPEEDITYTATYSIILGLENSDAPVAVYPNPASDIINIADPNINSVRVVNSIGKIVKLIPNKTSNVTQVDLSQLSSGVYVLFFSGETASGSTRILISHHN